MPKKIPRKNKAEYLIDGIRYKTKALYDFHKECKEAVRRGLIKDFEVPSKLSTKSRYTTYKPVVNGITFDSMMEARYYLFLLEEKKQGKIKDFKMQVPFELQPKFKKKNGKTVRAIDYVADFVIDDVTVVDVKGVETDTFKLKAKLFNYKYSGLELKILQFYPETNEWMELSEIRKLRKQNKIGTRK